MCPVSSLGEAKNLPSYPGPNKMRDCYCTVNLDQEEVFRTKIVEKSLCPFYGEDFYCEIPRSFRHLSFYIFDRDVFRRDSIIGKVAIQKEDLQRYHNRDTWFQLQHVDADSEVQVRLAQVWGCGQISCRLGLRWGEHARCVPFRDQALRACLLVVFAALVAGTLCQADGSSFKNTEGGKGGGTEKAKSVQ